MGARKALIGSWDAVRAREAVAPAERDAERDVDRDAERDVVLGVVSVPRPPALRLGASPPVRLGASLVVRPPALRLGASPALRLGVSPLGVPGGAAARRRLYRRSWGEVPGLEP